MKKMKVECISQRHFFDIPKLGETYVIDTDSLYIDQDGFAYADCYDLSHHHFFGHFNLRHFKSVK